MFSHKDFFSALKLLVKYLYFNLSPTDLHKQVFSSFLMGRSCDEIFCYADEFICLFFDDLINHKVLHFLQQAKKKNERIIVLSNSPQYLIDPIAHKLSIKECFGSTYNVDKDNRFQSISNIMDGKAKAKYTSNLSQEIDRKIVFSDSIWDRPFLEEGDVCYVVNPDSKLSVLAKTKGWNFL